MGRTEKTIIQNDQEESFELDLSPMLALMVCLIPIMLLSAEFVRVTIIESALPQVVEEAIKRDRQEENRDVLISLQMTEKGFQLDVKRGAQDLYQWSGPRNSSGDWDLDGLHHQLVKVKKQHTQIFRLDLRPDPTVSYDEIVQVIDEARQSRNEETRFTVVDEESQESAETQLMFPDVLFANLLEG